MILTRNNRYRIRFKNLRDSVVVVVVVCLFCLFLLSLYAFAYKYNVSTKPLLSASCNVSCGLHSIQCGLDVIERIIYCNTCR